MTGLDALGPVAARLNAMVAAGTLTDAEAEGVLQAFLDRNAPAETGEVTAGRIRQIERARRELLEEMMEQVGVFNDGVMARARAGLLALSDEEWEAAGGSLDEGDDGQNPTQ